MLIGRMLQFRNLTQIIRDVQSRPFWIETLISDRVGPEPRIFPRRRAFVGHNTPVGYLVHTANKTKQPRILSEKSRGQYSLGTALCSLCSCLRTRHPRSRFRATPFTDAKLVVVAGQSLAASSRQGCWTSPAAIRIEIADALALFTKSSRVELCKA